MHLRRASEGHHTDASPETCTPLQDCAWVRQLQLLLMLSLCLVLHCAAMLPQRAALPPDRVSSVPKVARRTELTMPQDLAWSAAQHAAAMERR